MTLRLAVLPARHGDCLWLEWPDGGRTRRLVVDGGTAAAGRRLLARLRALPPTDRRIELLVVSHVDADHIGGVLQVLEAGVRGLEIGDVWFNGRRHLPGPRSPVEGEALTDVLDGGVAPRVPWNAAVGGRALVVDDPGKPPVFELPGGLRLTLLSPTPEGLARLSPVWDRAVVEARRGMPSPVESQPAVRGLRWTVAELAAAPSRPDRAPANGSSIALLAERDGRSVLLAADAHPDVLLGAITALASSRGLPRLSVDVVKLPHHGSEANVTAELLEALDCRRWVFSSNGAVFGHPDPPAVARVILHGGADPVLLFNYRSRLTVRWADPALAARHRYHPVYPATRGAALLVDV